MGWSSKKVYLEPVNVPGPSKTRSCPIKTRVIKGFLVVLGGGSFADFCEEPNLEDEQKLYPKKSWSKYFIKKWGMNPLWFTIYIYLLGYMGDEIVPILVIMS